MKRIVILLCLLLPSSFTLGQTGFNARSMGMAGAYQGMARGAEVSSWNPANLALPENPNLSIDFLNFGILAGNNSLNLNLYNDYFSKTYFDEYGSWDEAAKNEIVDHIPSSGFVGFTCTEVTPLAISFNQFALAVKGFAYASANLPQDLLEVPLTGLGVDPVSLDDIDGEAIAGTEIAASYGMAFEPDWDWAEFITVGASFKYLIGHAYAVIDDAGGILLSNTDSIAINGTYRAFVVNPYDDKGETGRGIGLDLGTAVRVSKKLDLGLSLHNIFGSITFVGREEFWGSFAFNQPGLDLDEFDNFGDYLDSTAVDSDTSLVTDDKTTYTLPKSIQVSGAYRLSPKMTVEVDYHQGLNNVAGGTTTPRVAAGAELRHLKVLPLRLGFSLGGIQGTTFAFGFGLNAGIYKLDFAVANQRGLFNGSKGLTFAMAQRFSF